MILEQTQLIIISILLVCIVFIYIYLKYSHSSLQKEFENLNKELEEKNEAYMQLETSFIEFQKNNSGTSFVNEKIEKIQSLESEIIKQKKRIKDAKSIAQEATMVKYDFLSNIRHEVRTPMNSVLVFAQLLQAEIKDAKLLTYADNIYSSGRKLLNFMDKIIELSRIESGVFDIKESAIDIRNSIETSLQRHQSIAMEKGLTFKVNIDENIPQSLMIDGEKMSEILYNLVENAIKFTEEGFVEINVMLEHFNESKNLIDLVINVQDSGSGIAKENQAKIFEIFEKRDNANEIEFQGTGLGLSINRKMARLMNGDIKVKSELGEGALFTFTLKGVEIVLSNKEEKIDESKINFSLLNISKIIVVDDSQTVEDVEKYFKGSRVELFAYNNLKDAIRTLSSNKIEMILIDFDILNMDNGAVFKVITSMTDAKIVTLNNSRIKDVPYGTSKNAPVGHLKKPLSKTELFKISLKILNLVQIKNIADLENINFETELSEEEKAQLKAFVVIHKRGVEQLFAKATATNDLNAIKVFAEALYKLALKFNIKEFIEFAQKLLNSIELFDIDAINIMLNEYQNKIKRAQNL